MLDDTVGYLRPGRFGGTPGRAMRIDLDGYAAFIDSAFVGLIGAGCQRLIIDLRQHPGGDRAFADRLVSWFADKPWQAGDAGSQTGPVLAQPRSDAHFAGESFVLVDRSSRPDLAALVQRHGFARVIGEAPAGVVPDLPLAQGGEASDDWMLDRALARLQR